MAEYTNKIIKREQSLTKLDAIFGSEPEIFHAITINKMYTYEKLCMRERKIIATRNLNRRGSGLPMSRKSCSREEAGSPYGPANCAQKKIFIVYSKAI